MDNYSAEAEQIGRRRRMAEMLMQSGADVPQGQMVSGHYVAPNPTQYLAQALRSYMGGKGIYNAEQQETALRQRQAQAARDWMNQMPRGTENTSMAGPSIPQQPSAEDYMNWGIRGMQVDPRAAQMGMQSANLALNREDKQQGRAQQEQLRRDQLAQQAQQAEQNRALQREIANIKAQGGEKPYFQPVQTAQGIYSFNARTGKMELVPGGGGSPVIGSQSDPALQGRIAGAKESAELAAKSGSEAQKAVRKSDVMLQQIEQAEDLLKKGPTSSGIGAAVDAAGNLVGVSSKSADTAAQLAAISGWLVANVPRMEGPQSNFDVQNYQMMAGMVGDKTKPISQRMKALEEVKKLQAKYRDFNQEVIGGQPAEQKQTKRIRFDAEGNIVQ